MRDCDADPIKDMPHLWVANDMQSDRIIGTPRSRGVIIIRARVQKGRRNCNNDEVLFFSHTLFLCYFAEAYFGRCFSLPEAKSI